MPQTVTPPPQPSQCLSWSPAIGSLRPPKRAHRQPFGFFCPPSPGPLRPIVSIAKPVPVQPNSHYFAELFRPTQEQRELPVHRRDLASDVERVFDVEVGASHSRAPWLSGGKAL